MIPYGASLLVWFYFFYAFWGSPLPQTVYGNLVQTDLKNLFFGAPGLLFDQEYGLLAYAPVYILAATGLWVMWRDSPTSRRLAIEVVIVFAALLGTVGAFRIWWGGSASPGRPLTSGLLLLALPIAFAFRAAPQASGRRAAQHLLLWVSVGMSALLLFAEDGFLTANGRDGTSALLEYLSPRWPLWTIAPSFIQHEAPTALTHSALWLLLAAAAAVAIGRLRTTRAGYAALSALGITAAAILVATIVMPRLPFKPAWPDLDVRARSRAPILDEFDMTLRPVALEFTPLRLMHPRNVVTGAALEVEAGLRKEPQPLRVIHNGRFSLPAGSYRVEVDWSGARVGETIGLQLGRTGEPWQSWPVEPKPGERWSHEFYLPLDVSFVGLRGTPELERVVQRVLVIPLLATDRTSRPRGPEVIAASRSGRTSIFYYDRNVFSEANGFWVQGGRETRVAIFRDFAETPLTLRVHSGPVANRLRLSTGAWDKTVAIQPQSPETVVVDGAMGQLITLTLAADSSFVPRELDPASTDPRPLGVWIEVVQ